MSGAERVIVALDHESEAENLALIEALKGRARWFKIGMRQYYRDATRVLEAARAADAKIFLDLKLHDIPATVAGALEALAPIAPELLTIHASGGAAMVRAAREAVDAHTPQSKILAVTILTSMNDADVRVLTGQAEVEATVSRLALNAVTHGAHGVVASPLEAATLRTQIGDALIVTPGVRPKGAAHGDQQRVTTPRDAIEKGADLLVIGRPIYASAEPRVAFDAIVEELA